MKMGMRCCAVLAVFSMLAMPVWADDTPTTAPQGVGLVDGAEALALQAKGATVVDTRVAVEFAEGHAKGAVNIPYREKSVKALGYNPSEDSFDVTKLPADKAAPIVTYCNGAHCWKSYKAAIKAVEAGHTDVHWLRTGIEGWKAAGGSVE